MRREALGLISNQQNVSSRHASTRIKHIYIWKDASGWAIRDGQQYLCQRDDVPPQDDHDDSAKEQGPSHDDDPSQRDDNRKDNNQSSAGDSPRYHDNQQERTGDIKDDN
eukprot:12531576-Ditylum_brightwellii.AAC.1